MAEVTTARFVVTGFIENKAIITDCTIEYLSTLSVRLKANQDNINDYILQAILKNYPDSQFVTDVNSFRRIDEVEIDFDEEAYYTSLVHTISDDDSLEIMMLP
jgi:hypothetical protein